MAGIQDTWVGCVNGIRLIRESGTHFEMIRPFSYQDITAGVWALQEFYLY